MLDVTENILKLMSDDAIAQMLVEHRKSMYVSTNPQATLMFAKLAAHHSAAIGRQRDDYYDFSHAVNFKALAACLARYVDPNTVPSNDEPARPDAQVGRLFGRQLMEELNLHQAACMRNGLRKSFYDLNADRYELRLTKRRRRSALTLLDEPAQMELLSDTSGVRVWDKTTSPDDVMAAFASGAEHLRFIQEANLASWKTFESAVCTTGELTAFTAFIVFLEFAASQVRHSLLYSKSKLLELLRVFEAAFPNLVLGDERLMQLIAIFSSTPAEADQLLLPVPFFRIQDRYLRCEGFSKIMNPTMGLLTVAIRKHEKVWNDSVGSTLAGAAGVVERTLPKFDRLLVATRRKLSGGGDIDLALYDIESGHLLLCEVKTVYDKHRTVLHMHRFEEAKIKIAHAVNQLRQAIAAVKSGGIAVNAIFGRKIPAPKRVSGALLTWLDAIDLTVGTADEDILCMNFATLRYLVRRSAGNIEAMHAAVHQLRNIWCISELKPIDLQVEVPTRIETQMLLIDAASDLARLKLNSVAQAEVDALPKVPDGWRIRTDASEMFVSYFTETADRLRIIASANQSDDTPAPSAN